MYLVKAEEMQEMDRQSIESFGIPGRVLMENAGRCAVEFFFEVFPDVKRKKVGVIAGRGNNGGDGFVMARYIACKDIDVTVYLCSSSQRVQGDAEANLRLLKPLNVDLVELPDQSAFEAHQDSIKNIDIWIDALLGTGLNSDVRGYFKYVIDFINSLKKPVFAVDIPSGLHSDTGQPCGTCIQAAATASFGLAKSGLLVFPGASFAGRLEIADIGIPPHIVESVGPSQHLITKNLISSYFTPRDPEAHKGTTGHLLIIAGSPGKTGAAAMAALSAMRIGAGLVSLGIPESLNSILETQVLEVMTAPLPEEENGILGLSCFKEIEGLISGKKCLALGPGLGTDKKTGDLVRNLILKSTLPIVIDADGLNHIAGHTELLKKASSSLILTPHPGEMARLIDKTPAEVQKDRINCARDFAESHNIHLVLKGAGTVIAHPDGSVFINRSGNPGMASGGMGDVLTGVIAGFISQGLSVEKAVQAGVYIHGAAADTLINTIGPVGFLASDLIDALPGKLKEIIN
ncbi:ADP-dependent (S)-NAD(P)H-hydrate dehydratase / NAD(P)H-hydrate epimerase [Candidatus Magnetomoraceae bacterium gMMP-15]